MDELIAFLTRNCCQGAAACLQNAHVTPDRRRYFVQSAGGDPMTLHKIVLVLCTGNSRRSQMEEGHSRPANWDLRIDALSAGTAPQSRVAEERSSFPGNWACRPGCTPKRSMPSWMNPIWSSVSGHCGKLSAVSQGRPVIHVGFHDPHGESLDSFIAVRNDIRARLVPAVRAADWRHDDVRPVPVATANWPQITDERV